MDEFEGYVVFEFPHTQKVLMKCLIAGNAIYVIEEDWQTRARQPTREQDYAATEADNAELLAWAGGSGSPDRVGVEGSGSFGVNAVRV